MKNAELKNINFMYTFNKFCLCILIVISIILMAVPREVSAGYGLYTYKETTHPYVGFGIGIMLIGIIYYYVMKFIIEWAENTFYIRKSNDELVELIKKQMELLSGKINE